MNPAVDPSAAARAAASLSASPPQKCEAGAAERVFYGEGVEVAAPASYEELRRLLQEAAASRRLIIPAGFGHHAYLGNPPPDGAAGGPESASPLVVSLRRLDAVLRYEPGDFTAGVQAGLGLQALREALAQNGQEIPVDFPPLPRGSIGGAVASARCGPRRGRYGGYRNFIIGLVGMRGDGTIYKTGGMVVKNVAGYDLAKLLAGSLGTLGLILEVNFKLRPLPQARRARLAFFPAALKAWDFARELIRRRLDPAALTVLDPTAAAALGRALGQSVSGWAVHWLFEGNANAVAYLEQEAGEALKSLLHDEPLPLEGPLAARSLDWLAAFQEPENPAARDLFVLRLSALPAALRRLQEDVASALSAENAAAGSIAEPASGLLTSRGQAKPEGCKIIFEKIRGALKRHGANGRILFAPRAVMQAEDYWLLPDPNRALARRIQKVFDPGGIFWAGRMSR